MTSLELDFLVFSDLRRFGEFSNVFKEFSVFFSKSVFPREMHLFSNVSMHSCTLDLRCTTVDLVENSGQVVRHGIAVGLAVVGVVGDVVLGLLVVGVLVAVVVVVEAGEEVVVTIVGGIVGCRLVLCVGCVGRRVGRVGGGVVHLNCWVCSRSIFEVLASSCRLGRILQLGWVGWLVRVGVGWVLLVGLGFRVLTSLIAGLLVVVDFFCSNLCKWSVLGVKGALGLISNFLLGC